MRKLTVKNFSVIKDAELEFGKITVLIGPQSSGKSLLCKLAYFLGREVIRIAIDLVVGQRPIFEIETAVHKEFARWFPRGGWGNEAWSISFTDNNYEVTISALAENKANIPVAISFKRDFAVAYEKRLQSTIETKQKNGFLLGPALQSRAATEFLKVAGRGVWDSSTYIPTERSYFVDTKKGYRSLASDSDPILQHFANIFAESLKPSSTGSRVSRFLDGDVVSWQNEWMLSFRDGRFLPLSELSSGSKETLPILTTLDYYENQRIQSGNLPSAELYNEKLYSFDDFTIEEPESSVFPQTQYELIQEIAALANKADFVPHFTITTHSPYILTAFNTLIEAWRVGNKEGKRERVAALIPEKYWVNENDFAAYSISNGMLTSIFSKEVAGEEGSGLIDGDFLDSVSDQLGSEFDKLLDIEYAN